MPVASVLPTPPLQAPRPPCCIRSHGPSPVSSMPGVAACRQRMSCPMSARTNWQASVVVTSTHLGPGSKCRMRAPLHARRACSDAGVEFPFQHGGGTYLSGVDGDVVLVLCPHVSIRANRFVLRCSIRNARSDLLRSRRGPKTWCRTGVDKHEEVIQDGPGGRASIRPIGSKGP